MKPALPIAVFVFLCLAACSSLPQLTPLPPSDTDSAQCRAPFVTENRQFVHTISATLPGGNHSLVTGITTVFPKKRSVHAVIMALEGLVLFEGVIEEDQIDIQRAIPPFSSKSFATGLMHDVRMIFLSPATGPVLIGSSDRNRFVCRYRASNKSTIDLSINRRTDWDLVEYGPDRDIKRRISARYGGASVTGPGNSIPSRINLTTEGTFGYRLEMQLIQQTPY